MPSLIGTTVTNNYLKAAPSTQFSTRQLSVLNVAMADVFVGHALKNSLFSKAVRALQQTAEVYAVFTPVDGSPDSFNVIIATDTQTDGDTVVTGGIATGTGYGILETAIQAGSGVAATVTAVAGCVAPANYDVAGTNYNNP
jgi:hypothetical protein